MILKIVIPILIISIFFGCTIQKKKTEATTFDADLSFLEKYTDVVLLSDKSGKSQVIVSPKLQGRVLTSTADGKLGLSFGWINRELISSDKIMEHINAFGGEDRFWLGPEGGQFSIFFKPGVPFNLEHWFTPAPIDTEPFELISSSTSEVSLQKDIELENYSGTILNLNVDRQVRVLEQDEAINALAVTPGPTIKMVAFESNNKITNTGDKPWEKETGLLSIWILGMFNPSPTTTVVIPFNPGFEEILGPIVTDKYFGKVPSERLVVRENILFFSGDGKYRSKIGLLPARAKSILGSYDATNKVLTIVQYSKSEGVTDYVNSMWEIQDEPYRGDVLNSYNDGPAEPGAKPLGPFYELETSSPAAALAPGESIIHVHRTFHLQGSEEDLNAVAQATLGVTIEAIKSSLPE